jgi:hypothetical protein
MFNLINPRTPKRPCSRALLFLASIAAVLFTNSTLVGEQPASQTETKPKVYIAGIGTTPYIQDALDEITDYVVGKKVLAKQLAEGEGKTRNQLAARVKELGGQNLLYLSLDLEKGASFILRAQCVNAEGERLWEDEAAGPMIATSTSSAVKSMIKKMQKKLESQVGKTCLPVE